MSRKLTPKQVRAYIYGANPDCCPFCGSPRIVSDPMKVEPGPSAYQAILCGDCNESWVNGYTLDRVGCGDTDEFEFVEPTPDKIEG